MDECYHHQHQNSPYESNNEVVSSHCWHSKSNSDDHHDMDNHLGLVCLTPQEEINPSAGMKKGKTNLKFGIDNILQPNFGIKAYFHNHHQYSPPLLFGATNLCYIPSTLASAEFNSTNELLPSWIFCTRYSDRPNSGPRIRKSKRKESNEEEKRPRTAFTAEQLERLKTQFMTNRYLTEKRRQELAHELGLNESQIKIWFQNKRAKLKKSAQRAHQSAGIQNLMSQGIYKR